ncbi:MAG: ankyrin repeat domain-containing protein [Gammaproteobacteria bacterium]|nr:ankyrin repeat domain-containing protein [Gammaproteobacteria bacterium]
MDNLIDINEQQTVEELIEYFEQQAKEYDLKLREIRKKIREKQRTIRALEDKNSKLENELKDLNFDQQEREAERVILQEKIALTKNKYDELDKETKVLLAEQGILLKGRVEIELKKETALEMAKRGLTRYTEIQYTKIGKLTQELKSPDLDEDDFEEKKAEIEESEKIIKFNEEKSSSLTAIELLFKEIENEQREDDLKFQKMQEKFERKRFIIEQMDQIEKQLIVEKTELKCLIEEENKIETNRKHNQKQEKELLKSNKQEQPQENTMIIIEEIKNLMESEHPDIDELEKNLGLLNDLDTLFKTIDIDNNNENIIISTVTHRPSRPEILEALISCARSRNLDFLDLLDRDEWTALHHAVKNADVECVRILLDKDTYGRAANPNIVDKNGRLPLHIACIELTEKKGILPDIATFIIRRLLEAMDPEMIKKPANPYVYIKDDSDKSFIIEEYKQIEENAKSPLGYALMNENHAAIKLLYIKGIGLNPKAKDPNLLRLVETGHSKAIRKLPGLEQQLSEIAASDMERAFYIAAAVLDTKRFIVFLNQNKLAFTLFFNRYKATLDKLRDKSAYRPLLYYAYIGNNLGNVILLEEKYNCTFNDQIKGAKSTDTLINHIFYHLCQAKGIELIQRLISYGCDPNCRRGEIINLPVNVCAGHKKVDFIQSFFECAKEANIQIDVNPNKKGASIGIHYLSKVDTRVIDKSSSRPLVYSAKLGRDKMLIFLLEQGAEINTGDDAYASPLHAAVKHGHQQVVRILLSHGADPNVYAEGAPLAWLARDRGDILKLLIKAGANCNFNCPGEPERLFYEYLVGKKEKFALNFPQYINRYIPIIELLKNTLQSSDASCASYPVYLARKYGVDSLIFQYRMHSPQFFVSLLFFNLQNEKNKANIDELNQKFGSKEQTLLHIAAKHDNTMAVEALLNAGATPQLKNSCGETPLKTAARYKAHHALSIFMNRTLSGYTIKEVETLFKRKIEALEPAPSCEIIVIDTRLSLKAQEELFIHSTRSISARNPHATQIFIPICLETRSSMRWCMLLIEKNVAQNEFGSPFSFYYFEPCALYIEWMDTGLKAIFPYARLTLISPEETQENSNSGPWIVSAAGRWLLKEGVESIDVLESRKSYESFLSLS